MDEASSLHPPGESVEASGAIARNAFHLVLGQAGSAGLAILLAALLGRRLGAADFGIYYLLTSTTTFAFVLGEWGQSMFVMGEVARHRERSAQLLGTALALRGVAALLLVAFTPLALWAMGHESQTLRLCALFTLASTPVFLAQGCSNVFRGFERMELDARFWVVSKFLVLAVSAAALFLGGGLVGVIVAIGVAGLMALALVLVQTRRLGVRHLRVARETARELLVGGTPLVALGLAVAATSAVDVMVLSRLAPAESVGWYGAARNIFGTIGGTSAILGTAAFPRFSRAAGDRRQFAEEVAVALRPLLGLAALAAVGTWLFADLAVGVVFGREKFGPAVQIIRVFSPGQLLLFVDVLLGTAVVAAGRATWLAVVKAVNLAVIVGLGLVLVPYFQAPAHGGNGGIGIVLAIIGSELMMFLAEVWLLPRGTLRPSMLLDAARALGASAGTLLLFWALPPLSPFVGLPLCVLTFAGLAVATGLVRRSELERIRARFAPRRT